MTVNERIENLIKFLNLNARSFSELIGAKEATTRNYLGRGSMPNAEYLELIFNSIENINAEWLLSGKGDMFKEKEVKVYANRTDTRVEEQAIPLYDHKASAGLTKLFSNSENILDYIRVPNLPKCDGAVHISGDSMYPLLKSGDIVMYKQIHDILNGIFWGEMYLVSLNLDDEDYTLVKYIQRSELGDDFVKLVSQNQHHAPKDVPLKSIRALGYIKASIRINSMA